MWSSGSGPAGTSGNDFSIRWKGTFIFSGGTYTFNMNNLDDGGKVYIDDTLVSPELDSWKDQGPTNYSASRSLTAGSHTIQLEYYEHGGGSTVLLSWSQTAGLCPSSGNSVTLGSSSIVASQTTTASPPAGFSGGSFSSSNTGVASVSGSTVTGVATGSANITGSGWAYSNGATNCPLAGAALTVTEPPPPPPGGGDDGGGGGCNSKTCSPIPPGGGSNPDCGIIRLFWTDNSSNETGFKIYVDGIYTLTAPASSPASATGGLLSYDYNPGDNNPHDFSISATNASGDSAMVSLTNPGGIAASNCSKGDLSTSDKDITVINGVAITGASMPEACNGGTDDLPSATSLKLGDKLTFQINLCNKGNGSVSSIKVTDTMVNLKMPAAGWNAKFDGTPLFYDGVKASSYSPVADHYFAYGTVPNQTLVFNLATTAHNLNGPGSSSITFDGQLAVPTGYSGSTARFQNGFIIYYNKATGEPATPVTGFTPLLLFSIGGGVPTIIEIP
jgi:hypothetical protein